MCLFDVYNWYANLLLTVTFRHLLLDHYHSIYSTHTLVLSTVNKKS